ncbi:MAG: UDP-N-acetylmuramate dehydrogenase [Candidatus Omnitrophica bacterium]|nr:UDP-N-acetylmuramate dehydrogenase [Candidatus Omnitrophota bacterium]
MNYCKDLRKVVKGKIVLDEPLKGHTTFRIGGPAKVWVEPYDVEDLKNILKFVKKNKISFFVIGEGSNLLVKDEGFNGIVIKLSSDYFNKIKSNNTCIIAGGGVKLSKLIDFAKRHSLGGCEFLSGIPGSIGGALAMNAGTRINSVINNQYQSIGDLVKEVEVIDFNGNRKILKARQLKFAYRSSNLLKYIILFAKLNLKPRARAEIENEITDYLSYRKRTQDSNWRNAGCVFKNPLSPSDKLLSAGYLIDACGLKKHRMGGAVVSSKHANFIINDKNAKARDVTNLIKYIKKVVKDEFDVELALELKIV